MMQELNTLLSRLATPDPAPRRIAIFDLIALSRKDPRAMQALLTHLSSERDEKTALAIIRHLAAAAYGPAKPALWRLYEDPQTSARIAHAAIIAHDQLLAQLPDP